MNVDRLTRRALLAGGISSFALPALGQGFAGLGTAAGDFTNPSRSNRITFPADHAPHPAYRIEWWYVTANLETPDGTPMGVQWTLFRSALAPRTGAGWSTPQAWMGHAAVTTPEIHLAAERLARGGVGQAGVEITPFRAWIDGWEMAGPSLTNISLRAAGEDFSYDLTLSAEGPFVLQGDAGYSVKSPQGQASHYYSQPFYRAEGRLTLPGGEVQVTGRAWLDREWSSQPLAENQSGWDWFSLYLGGPRIMGFRLRAEGASEFTAATWIEPDGSTTPYPDGAFRAEPLESSRVAGREVPTRWRVTLPDRGLDAEVTALNGNAWMPLAFPYWEGPVTVSRSHDGMGYLEMTGYE